jgi:hypothetical protein
VTLDSRRADLRISRRAEAELARKREDPLPDRNGGEDVAHEVVGGVLHPAGVAGGAAPALAGERDEALEAAARTADSSEAVREDAAVEIGAQVALDVGGEPATGRAPVPDGGEERL